jgi:hypothetical protein
METMKVAHTPGPWTTSRDAVPEGIVQITVYAEQDGERVATVFQSEANAPLIAAAPDLLDACRDAEQYLGATESGPPSTLLRTVRAAIAKAQG